MTITEMMQRDAQYSAPLRPIPINIPSPSYADGSIIYMPFDITSALNSLALYASSEATSSLLEAARMFLWDDRYYWSARAIPSTLQQGNSNRIPAYQQYEDQLSVPSGSFLLGIGKIGFKYTGDNINFGSAASFRIRLYDAGAQEWLSDDFIRAGNIGANNTQQRYTGPFWLPSPLSITSPGLLNVSIVNLESVDISVDMAFFFACPQGIAVQAARLTGAKPNRKE